MTKQEIESTVSLFYPATVKVYYVNSSKGVELTPPYERIFVSLGITTSIKMLEEVRNNLDSVSYLKATLATLHTIRTDSGRYCNEIIKIGDYTKDDQYSATKLSGGEFEKILDRAASFDMYDELLHSEQVEVANELKTMIEHFDEKDCWDEMAVVFDIFEGIPFVKPFHRYINYHMDPSTKSEYRIGILVEEKKK